MYRENTQRIFGSSTIDGWSLSQRRRAAYYKTFLLSLSTIHTIEKVYLYHQERCVNQWQNDKRANRRSKPQCGYKIYILIIFCFVSRGFQILQFKKKMNEKKMRKKRQQSAFSKKCKRTKNNFRIIFGNNLF
jgi:hypothetical protein